MEKAKIESEHVRELVRFKQLVFIQFQASVFGTDFLSVLF